jgi:hypothetical protein
MHLAALYRAGFDDPGGFHMVLYGNGIPAYRAGEFYFLLLKAFADLIGELCKRKALFFPFNA